jgi:Ribbon-helix-helix protein, copG family
MGRPKGKRKQARISVSFDDGDFATLRALAHDRDASVAWVVRQAVHGLIEQEKSKGTEVQLSFIPRLVRQEP